MWQRWQGCTRPKTTAPPLQAEGGANDWIPKDLYLNVDQDLQYPSLDDFVNQMLLAGNLCKGFSCTNGTCLEATDNYLSITGIIADWDSYGMRICILTPHTLFASAHLCRHVKEPQMLSHT